MSLTNWLNGPIDLGSDPQNNYYLLEIESVDEGLKEYLTTCIRDSYSDPEKIKKHLQYLHLTTLLNLIKLKIPKKFSTQKSEFGEILCRVTLEDCFSLVVPVCKLHFKTDPESPVHGMDVIAFRFYENPMNDCIYLAEAKTAPSQSYAETSPRKIKKNFEGLKRADILEELGFIIDQLATGNRDHYLRVISMLNVYERCDDINLRLCPFLVQEKSYWKENNIKCIRESSFVNPIFLIAVTINGLSDLFEETYKRAIEVS